MPSFPRPKFPYTVDLKKEISHLREYKKHHSLRIPTSRPGKLLIATWNIANFGEQDRQPEHLSIIAEMISWFDIVALQETKENLGHLNEILKIIGTGYKTIFSDEGGNNERMLFIYRVKKVVVLDEIAELAVSPQDYKNIKLPGVQEQFKGFDRTPFIVSFQVKGFRFSLLNVHLYFGNEKESASIDRRCLEAFCVGRWADLRSRSAHAYTTNVFAMGDFNLPKLDKDDKVYKALVAKGLQLPEHSSKVYSNLNDDKAYDQIAFLPGLKARITATGIFPFDNVLFPDLYKSKSAAQFRSYIKYYISDHRPMWMELDVTQ